MEASANPQVVGLIMICAILALVESMFFYSLFWQPSLRRLQIAESLGASKSPTWLDQVKVMLLQFVPIVMAVFIGWLIWDWWAWLPPALIATFVVNAFLSALFTGAYLHHRRSRCFF